MKMKLRWQFLILCGIVASAAGMIASCGPERPFCPYGPDKEFICVPVDEAGAGGGGGTAPVGPCDGAAPMIVNGVSKCPWEI